MKNYSFSDLKNEGTISLTTYYTNGKGVATPVGYSKRDNKIFVNTRALSYKIKRLRKNPKARIALCNMRGKVKSPFIDVQVRILEHGQDDEAKEVMRYDSKFSWRFMRFMNKITFWKKPDERIFLEIIEK